MQRDLLLRVYQSLFKYVFYDEVRLFELFSALNLMAWATVLITHPELLETEVYESFGAVDADFWSYCFGFIAALQIAATLLRRCYPLEFRFVAMSLSSGAWTVVAWNFWQSSLSTTANLNYTLLATGCALSGLFLAWKSSTSQHL